MCRTMVGHLMSVSCDIYASSAYLEQLPHTVRLGVRTCSRSFGLAASAFGAHAAATRHAVTQLVALWSRQPLAECARSPAPTSAHWCVWSGYGDFDQLAEQKAVERYWRSLGYERCPNPDPRFIYGDEPPLDGCCQYIAEKLIQLARRSRRGAVAIPVAHFSWRTHDTEAVRLAMDAGSLPTPERFARAADVRSLRAMGGAHADLAAALVVPIVNQYAKLCEPLVVRA